MKARRFLAVVLAVILVLLGLGGAAWWLVWQRSPLQLQQRALTVPRAARFVPRDADLSLHLLSDAELPLAYARAVAAPRRRAGAAASLARLRDGAFAAAGLDYPGELASWLGAETGLWLLAGEEHRPAGWVLALSSRDGDGARRFLQRFWQTRSLAGADLQVSSYRGMGLISGRAALLGREPVPVATALIDDDLVLLASGRGLLEQALDVSQIDELNQAADPAFRRSLERLGQGVVLLTARPSALADWLGSELPGAGSLVAALRPQGPDLLLEGWLEAAAEGTASAGEVGGSPFPAPAAGDAGDRLLAALRGEAEGLALLQDPARWSQAWQERLRPWLAAVPAEDSPPLPVRLAAATEGPLVVRRAADEGWLLGSSADSPDPALLAAELAEDGLVAAPLELGGDTVQVWTRLEAPARRRGGPSEQLQASLMAARRQSGGLAWWSDSLTALAEQQQSRQTPRLLLDRLDALGLSGAPLRWVLAAEPARQLLAAWFPWRLLSGLAAQPLAEPVQGLGLALQGEDGGLHLRARLSYG
ncbi:DUF3352 domain-containing protein [Cyanobium sp. CH-040]|uniref:DUF3352 domain-containing protein n=1 Tax=Cyanobium sp. CH-040 TaxID=2823708 RepID=UPI0020CFBA6E|nr:DUF3352 domain-containing protein [Cyanobium sp. CH-040]MCP9926758.1 DUF3352 domain-containing protein [Cyanobium sp. CH-040]